MGPYPKVAKIHWLVTNAFGVVNFGKYALECSILVCYFLNILFKTKFAFASRDTPLSSIKLFLLLLTFFLANKIDLGMAFAYRVLSLNDVTYISFLLVWQII